MKNVSFLQFMRVVKAYEKQAITTEYRLGRYALELQRNADGLRYVEFYFTLEPHPDAVYMQSQRRYVILQDNDIVQSDNVIIGVYGYLVEKYHNYQTPAFRRTFTQNIETVRTLGFQTTVTNSGSMTLDTVAAKIRRYHPLTVDHWYKID